MARYRARPVEVEAVQWLKPGDHHAVIRDVEADYIDTKSGRQSVEPGDWIIAEMDGSGQHYPVKPHIFAEKYEAIDERKQGAQIGGERPDYVPERQHGIQGMSADEARGWGIGETKGQQIAGDPNEPHNRFGERGVQITPANRFADVPKMQQQPSVGRIVHFYSASDDDSTDGKSCAAIIVDVFDGHPDQAVNLVVFHPYGGSRPFHSVPLRSLSQGGPRWWDWPPHVPARPVA